MTPFDNVNIGDLEDLLSVPHCPAMPVETDDNSVV
jgi:hypothetical protein